MKRTALIALALIVFVSTAVRVGAQYYSAPPPAPDGRIMASSQLDQLLGPIALYPDPLIAQILPAATQPGQIAVAYNYLTQGGDPNSIDQQPWDSSVKAVAHYPDVLRLLDSSLPWAVELGQAFLDQPNDVMDSIQRLRAQAQALGNLQSNPEETVVNGDGEIDIVPANPNIIYVPTYDPGIIYYQRPYGQDFISFGLGFGIGAWLDHDFDWHNHHVVAWGRDHPRPEGWWHERPEQRRETFNHADVWRPTARVQRGPVVVNRGDRGFERQPTRVEAPRQPQREVRAQAPRSPQHEAAPAPRSSVQVHTVPSRPTVSAFNPPQSAHEAHAASSRGEASRQSGGGAGGGGGGRKH